MRKRVTYNIEHLLLLVFLISSILKSVNIYSFALEVRMYIDAYMPNWLQPFVMAGAIGACAIELLITLLALKRDYSKATAMGFFLMLSFFAYLTGANLFCPTLMGSIESCGCFGEFIHFTPLASFAKSATLWILSFVLVVGNYRTRKPWNFILLLRDKYLYICAAGSLVLPSYSLWLFNKMSHAAYICGFGVLCVTILCIVAWSLRDTSKGCL